MTIKTEVDHGGHSYRRFEYNGRTIMLYSYSSKYTLYYDHGIVNAGQGSGYSFTLPDGRVLEGYTNDPFIVQQYVELWNDSNKGLKITTDHKSCFNPYGVA